MLRLLSARMYLVIMGMKDKIMRKAQRKIMRKKFESILSTVVSDEKSGNITSRIFDERSEENSESSEAENTTDGKHQRERTDFSSNSVRSLSDMEDRIEEKKQDSSSTERE